MTIDDRIGQDPPGLELSPKMHGYLTRLAEHHPAKFAGVEQRLRKLRELLMGIPLDQPEIPLPADAGEPTTAGGTS